MNESKITEILVESTVAVARQTTELIRPEYEARRDVAKTLISLASASLVFTITFSPSFATPNTPLVWRCAVVACWLAFICALVLSLASLWLSMGLARLPILMMQNVDQIKEAARDAMRTSSPDPVIAVYQGAVEKIARHEMLALWLLRASATCFGAALLILTIIGVRRLIH